MRRERKKFIQYSSPDIMKTSKSRIIRLLGHIKRLWDIINVYTILIERPEGKRKYERFFRRRESGIEWRFLKDLV